ncbi:MAG: hypothetical protein J2P53_08270 [Bradyrhizobiaceae bacterium]|nr:hypothetical protein [Bradyrhizobiaceae bacterium]
MRPERACAVRANKPGFSRGSGRSPIKSCGRERPKIPIAAGINYFKIRLKQGSQLRHAASNFKNLIAEQIYVDHPPLRLAYFINFKVKAFLYDGTGTLPAFSPG